MKTTKLVLSITLVALATAAIGQRTFVLERLFPDRDHQEVILTSENQTECSRVEFWIHNLQGKSSKKVTWDVYETPTVTQTFFVEQVEVIYEEEVGLESWMSSPFESSFAEEDIILESWMTIPFNEPEVMEIEEWMTTVWF
ncbi:MAG: hypothetical protein ABFS38_00130 [Bacteroidota bacterium]